MYFLFFIGFMLLSLLVSQTLKSKFKKYREIPLQNNLTGRDIATKMLRDHGIYDVHVSCTEGQLTDHYDPQSKTINLSTDVYEQSNLASAAVAAHECGHAVQHANSYAMLQVRSALVPVVSLASNWIQWILLAGILLVNSFPSLLMLGIALFALTTLFSFITLPVEIDASHRALQWLKSSGLTTNDSVDQAKDALTWAAYTYVVAALASLATLLYYISFLNGRRN